MKIIVQTLTIFLLLTAATQVSYAQNDAAKKEKAVVTTEIEVMGVCGMCKERIENAALIKGVKYAKWDLESSMLTVVYKNWKTTEMEVHKAVAEVGHDTPKVKATEEQYADMPGCCDYRGGVEKH